MTIDVKNLRIYPFLKETIDIEYLSKQNFASDDKLNRYIKEFISGKDFTTIGLHKKAPLYQQGIKKQSEYCSRIDILTDTYPEDAVVVRKVFTDVTKDRMYNVYVAQANNTLNQVMFLGDFTDNIDVGDNHTLYDNIFTPTISIPVTVASTVYDPVNNVTVVVYQENIIGVAQGYYTVFHKGKILHGIDIKFQWLNTDGSVGIEKTAEHRFSVAEGSSYEHKRRIRTTEQMIATAKGTTIEPFVKYLFFLYSDEIEKYKELGDTKTWKDAIDNETDPVALAYLNTDIPIRDRDNNIVLIKLKDAIKAELYELQ